MAPHNQSDDGNGNIHPPVVAIDKDKHSQYAVRWAIDHLLITDPTIILIHVKLKNQNHSNGGDAQSVFTPFRAYGARKAIIIKEVIIEDTDISKGLLDYINNNYVANIVLGASSKNALARKFWTHDVPTIINKSAPDFCSVYVIHKGKTQSVRPAGRSMTNSPAPPRLPPQVDQRAPFRLSNSESEDGSRAMPLRGEQKMIGSDRVRSSKKGSNTQSQDTNDVSTKAPRISLSRNSISTDSDFPEPLNPGSIDVNSHNLDFTNIVEAPHDGNSSMNDVEAQMKRLKLELKQTMDMYNTACKEAISAKQTAKALHDWKLEEARRVEQALLAEEAALKIAEMEKAKCKAALEAAEKAQKLAEMEAQRRRFAEQKANREAEEKNRALNVLSKNDVRYRKYSIEEIEAATNSFMGSLKIGEGGYGPVFRASIDHTPVAIKVLRPDATQGRKQFQQEVEVLSCIRHPNMVLLLGACPEYGCLVYEYMDNGSLEDRLFRKGNTPSIPWHIRFKLAAEIATGLLFLHQAKPEPLVHRDLKPGNILLDHNYVCKISDVGLARLVPPSVADSVTQYHMTSAAGTFCYIDPEYQQTGKLGTKSDIYSLGVMLLQIITARPPMGLTHHVERAIEKGTLADLLDPTVPDWPLEETAKFAKLALKCAELRKRDRPDLGSVILPELNRLKELGMNNLQNNGIAHSLGHLSRRSGLPQRSGTQ